MAAVAPEPFLEAGEATETVEGESQPFPAAAEGMAADEAMPFLEADNDTDADEAKPSLEAEESAPSVGLRLMRR